MKYLKSIAYELLTDIIILDLKTDFNYHFYNFNEDVLIVEYRGYDFEIIDYNEEQKTNLDHIYVYDLIYQLRKIKLNHIYSLQPDFIEYCLEQNRNDARNLNLDVFIIIQKNLKTLEEM